MAEIFGFDAYSPSEIAEKVETIGIATARLPLLSQMLAVPAWSHWFISSSNSAAKCDPVIANSSVDAAVNLSESDFLTM